MTTPPPALHDLAVMAGATVLGEPSQYLFSLRELTELLRLAGGAVDLIRLHDRLQEKGLSVNLYVDNRR